jgi:hypothetical protein
MFNFANFKDHLALNEYNMFRESSIKNKKRHTTVCYCRLTTCYSLALRNRFMYVNFLNEMSYQPWVYKVREL